MNGQPDQPLSPPPALQGPSQGLPPLPQVAPIQAPPLTGGLLDRFAVGLAGLGPGMRGQENPALAQRMDMQQQVMRQQQMASQQQDAAFRRQLDLSRLQQDTERLRMEGRAQRLKLIHDIGEVAPEFAASEYEKLGILKPGQGAGVAQGMYAKQHPEIVEEAIGLVRAGLDPMQVNPSRYGSVNVAGFKGMSKEALDAAFPGHAAAATKRITEEANAKFATLKAELAQREAAGTLTTSDILADAKTPEDAGNRIQMHHIAHPEAPWTSGEKQLVAIADQKRKMDFDKKQADIDKAIAQADSATTRAQLAEEKARNAAEKRKGDIFERAAAVSIKERAGQPLTPEDILVKEEYQLRHPQARKPLPPPIAKSGEGVADLQQKLDRIGELLKDKEIRQNVGPGAGRLLTAKATTGLGLSPKLAEFYSLINNVYIQAGKEQFGARFTQSEMAILDKAKMGQNQPLTQLQANWDVWNRSNQRRLKNLRAQAKKYDTEGFDWVEGGEAPKADEVDDLEKRATELLGRKR